MRIESEIRPHLELNTKKNLKKGLPLVLIAYCFTFVIGLENSPFHIDLGNLTAHFYFIAGITFMYGLMQFLVPYKFIKMGLMVRDKLLLISQISLAKNAHYSKMLCLKMEKQDAT
jgi:hypothetical protein